VVVIASVLGLLAVVIEVNIVVIVEVKTEYSVAVGFNSNGC
jgi:hypothetical protein